MGIVEFFALMKFREPRNLAERTGDPNRLKTENLFSSKFPAE
jgi:hypothetical protein